MAERIFNINEELTKEKDWFSPADSVQPKETLVSIPSIAGGISTILVRDGKVVKDEKSVSKKSDSNEFFAPDVLDSVERKQEDIMLDQVLQNGETMEVDSDLRSSSR